MQSYSPCSRVLLFVFLSVFALSATSVWAQAESRNTKPSYATLSDEAVLKMELIEFQSRYGKDSIGTAADDLLYFYAAAAARSNERAARRISPTVAKIVADLRSRLQTWDAALFTPSEEFVGGSLEASHHAASRAVERKTMFKTLIPLMDRKTRSGKIAPEEKRARTAFHKWLADSAKDAVPMREQMEDKDADERADLRLNYAAWYTNLKTLARGLEATALKLPSLAVAACWITHAIPKTIYEPGVKAV